MYKWTLPDLIAFPTPPFLQFYDQHFFRKSTSIPFPSSFRLDVKGFTFLHLSLFIVMVSVLQTFNTDIEINYQALYRENSELQKALQVYIIHIIRTETIFP